MAATKVATMAARMGEYLVVMTAVPMVVKSVEQLVANLVDSMVLQMDELTDVRMAA